MSRDTIISIFLYYYNFEKSGLNSSCQIKFLGVEIDFPTMIVSLPLQKKEQIILQCHDLFNQSDVSLKQMNQLIG